jgi:SAM-dependent methyltransferase
MNELLHLMHSRIDHDVLHSVHDRFRNSVWEKFFDEAAYCRAAAEHALRLDKFIPRGARCLDLGCGFGYVALALECLGHRCIAWDIPNEMLRAVAQAIPVSERCFAFVSRDPPTQFQWVPPVGFGEFDLIILHGVFPMRDAVGWWEWKDYAKLLESLMRCLRYNGLIEVIVNRGDQLSVICNRKIDIVGYEYEISDNIISIQRRDPSCAAC